jgi:probable HAF family extracellular repeat protein
MRNTAHSRRSGAASMALAVLWTASAAVHACPPEYEYEMACAPPCGAFKSGAVGLDINEAGDIVGFAIGLCYNDRAFIWKAGSPSIQFLPMPAGTSQSRAYGINDKGQIVGYYVKSGNATKGFMIDNGVFFDMGTLPGGNWSEAYDVNDDGVAVGFWLNNVAGPPIQAMTWQDGVMTSLTPVLEQPMSVAYAINDAGWITGFLSPVNYNFDGRAFLWDGTQLTVLPPAPGAYTSFGRAINGLGQVAGWGNADCDPPQKYCLLRHGFFWDGEEMVALGSLPGYPNVLPYGLNDAGQIVGYMEELNNGRSFLWEAGELYRLNDLVPGFDEINLGTGFASAINNKGQIAGDVSGAMGLCVLRLTPKPRRHADLDCDGSVGASDLAILIQSWGAKDSPADLDRDGGVDAADLGILLGDWGD